MRWPSFMDWVVIATLAGWGLLMWSAVEIALNYPSADIIMVSLMLKDWKFVVGMTMAVMGAYFIIQWGPCDGSA